jgi:Icc protein
MALTLLHISDPHLDGGPDRAERLDAVLDLLPPSRRPDAIVATGDIADDGARAAYAQVRALMADRGPWIAAPGNHDDAARFAAELGVDSVSTLDVGRLRILALDVTVPGKGHGELRPEVAELAAERAAGAETVVLAFHQPPMILGHDYIDPIRLLNPEALTDLMGRLGTVAAVLCGHAHTAASSSIAGVPLLLAPGVVSTLKADSDKRPVTDLDHPPGMALHRFEDDGTVVSSFHFAV